jgi:hypothetical protein
VVYRYNLVQKSIFVFRTQLGQEQQKSGVTTHDHQEQITGENCNDFLSDAVGACGLGGPFFNGFPGRVGKPDKENIEESSTSSVYILEESERATRRATKCKDGKKQKKKILAWPNSPPTITETKLDGAEHGKRDHSSGVPK